MCGIAGYRCFGVQRPTGEELTNLLVESEDRGRDATGVAFITNHSLRVTKNGVPATTFVKGDDWKEVIAQEPLPAIMILHCRAGTGGSANDNRNNHPIFNKKGMALIHNGVISNHKELAKEYKVKLDGEVDSEIILKLIEEKWWGSIKNLNDLTGGFACAAIYIEQPEHLLLFRHNNPIVLYMDKERDILFFASTKNILSAALTKYHRGFAYSRIASFDMKDDSAILVGQHGVEEVGDINTRAFVTSYQWDNESKGWKTKGEHQQTRKQCGTFKGDTKGGGGGKYWPKDTCTDSMQTCSECKCRTLYARKIGNDYLCVTCLIKYSRERALYCADCYNSVSVGANEKTVWCDKCKKRIEFDNIRIWPMNQAITYY
jgi:hypothetical protein